MSQVINTNIASLNAQRNLNTSQNSLSTALQRLSSGLRINSAKDDAAGLAITDRMTSQVRGLNQAVRNANDAISMSQTAEGALGEMGNILQRIRELSVQAANATNSDNDRASLNSEVSELKQELSRIANNTTFNGQKILNGSLQSASFHVGADAGQTIKLSINSSTAENLGVNTKTTDNTTNGMAVATGNYRVDSGGGNATLMGKARTADALFATSNNYSAQTLVIKDSVGNVVVGGSINFAAGAQISDVVSRLNQISGVRATASSQLNVTGITSGLSSDGTATFTVAVSSGTITSSLNVSGVTTASSQSAIFTAIRDTINNDTNLKNAGVVAGLNSAGQLVLRNNTGADLGLSIDQSSATSDVVFTVTGTDVAATVVNLSADAVASNADSVVVAGGQMNVYLADGYSIQSSKGAASSYFNAAASAQVAASATGLGIDNVTTNSIPANDVVANGVLTGKANASNATSAVTNGYSAQTLTIRDASGTKVSGADSIIVAASASVDTIVSKLNNVAGILASASASLLVTDYTMNTAITTTTDISFAIISGSASVNLVLSGITSTSTDADVFRAMRDAINADTTLKGEGVTASIDSTGYLKVANNTGKNLTVGVAGTGASNSVVALYVRGTDAAATLVTLTSTALAAAGGAVSVGGVLNVQMADGYTIASNVAKTNSYFDVNANSAATTVVSGVNFGTHTAEQTLTIGGLATKTVTVSQDNSAEQIAGLINAETSSTGVTATARTQAKISGLSTAGTVSFDLYGTNGSATPISALVTNNGATMNLSSLASAINNKSATTGITATLADNNASIILKHETGANIVISNFSHSAASLATQSNIGGTQVSMQVTGLADAIDAQTGVLTTKSTTSTTLFTGGTSNLNTDSTVVGGTVTFNGANSFTVASSLAGTSRSGGNSSLFSTDADVASSSALFNVESLDISTVDGANQAIGAIDNALSQVSTIRSAMGAVQNRFQSTIASLSATSENISAARSRIQDTDFAQETANLTRAQILQLAGVAMLAQANQLPQLVLSLLK